MRFAASGAPSIPKIPHIVVTLAHGPRKSLGPNRPQVVDRTIDGATVETQYDTITAHFADVRGGYSELFRRREHFVDPGRARQ